MTMSAEYSLIHSELNGFLLAPIGNEENGMPLTVLSACARLDVDPWDEARRLIGLPREAAITAIADLIERLPGGSWRSSDIHSIAARLVELLPKPPSAKPTRKRRSINASTVLLAICLALGTAVVWRLPTFIAEYGAAPPPAAAEQTRR
jgi:hypothetical protein